MAEQQKQIIDFVTHLPTTINPYTATARMIGSLIKTPPMPRWSFILTCCELGGFVLMFTQAAFLVSQRIKTKKFCELKFNEVGLLVITLSDAVGLLLLPYAALTIVFMSEQLALHYGLVDESSLLLVFGYKFIFVLTCSWAFVYTCSCHCGTIISTSGLGSKLNQGKLDAVLRWSISAFFLGAIIGPYPFAMWSYTSAYREFCTMRSIVRQVQTALISAAPHYTSQTDDRLQVLQLLIPAGQLIPHFTKMEHNVLHGIKFYFFSLTLLSLVYKPLLFFSFRDLYKKTVITRSDIPDSKKPATVRWQPQRGCPTAVRDRRSLAYHALAVYTSTLVHLPFIFWQLSHSFSGFTINPTWNAVTYHGLAGPFSITGNIWLLIVNLHTRAVLNGMKSSSKRDSHRSFSATVDKFWQTFESETSPGRGAIKDEEIDLDLRLERLRGEDLDSKVLHIVIPKNNKCPEVADGLNSWSPEIPRNVGTHHLPDP